MANDALPATDVFITVDTEISTPLYDNWQLRRLDRELRRDIYGETNNGEFGIVYQLRTFRKYGLRATYFIDPFFSAITGPDVLKRVIATVLEYGQDVQLHIHTEWLPYISDNPLGQKCGYSINRFSQEQQIVLLEKAKQMLMAAGATRICAFRAGNWGANNDTLTALATVGIQVDSSYNPGHSECEIRLGKTDGFAPRTQGGVLELPLTVFRDGLNRPRPLQITSASFSEYRDLLWDARRLRIPYVVFCTHSMELIRPKRLPVRPEWTVIRRFERLCRFLSENTLDFRTVTLSELQREGSTVVRTDNLLAAVPCAKRLSTLKRVIGQAKRRIW